MKKFLHGFVLEYRAVLDMKIKYDFNHFRYKAIYNTLISFVLACIIFTGIGYLFNETSLHYLFICTNVTILGTFMVYRLSKEFQFRNHYKLDYKIRTQVIYEFLYLTILLLLVNEAISLILFSSLISAIYLIIQGLLSVIGLIIYSKLDEGIYYEGKRFIAPKRTHISLSVILITVQYIILIYALDIESIVISHLVATTIIFTLYLIKLIYLNDSLKFTNGYQTLAIPLAILALLSVLTVGNLDNYIDSGTISGIYKYNHTIVIETDTEFNRYNDDIYYTDNYIYIEIDDTLQKYDRNLNLVETYIYDNYKNVKYQVYSDDLIIAIESEFIESSESSFYDGYIFHFTDITDQSNIIEYPSSEKHSRETDIFNYTLYNDNFYIYYDLSDFGDKLLIQKDNNSYIAYNEYYHYEIYRIDSTFSRNNRLISVRNEETNLDELYLISAENAIEYGSNFTDEMVTRLDIDIPDNNSYFDSGNDLLNYYNDGENNYININDYILIYDFEYNFLNKTKVNNQSIENGSTDYLNYIFSDVGIYEIEFGHYLDDLDNNYIAIKSIDLEHLNNQYIIGENALLTSNSLLILFSISALIVINIPGVKNGGEIDE